ncbi:MULTISPECIES: DNA-methyltransferase [unclassified Bradyrhizobium]|uniref:DNA-methyltransferase n=1 Tax=unclassified Bradyrhizobium TaxID=2631580 RepID=UPI002916C768|nr:MULTISPECIES: DNA methyltransferase [unclassified Bradyrhizobium]
MTPESLLAGCVQLYCGDNRDALAQLADNSIDSIVTDPPYALVSIVKRFGKAGAAPAKGNAAYARASIGFMGQAWDTGEVAFSADFWRECFRVLKPGGHVLAFSGTRTYHRLAVAIEDAGFEIRDMLSWLYGSGFPKNHDVALDFEITLCERRDGEWYYVSDGAKLERGAWRHPMAVLWDGWGTAVKPGCEPVCMGRKPLAGRSVIDNLARWLTGAINIDACRVAVADGDQKSEGGATTGRAAESDYFDRLKVGDNRDGKGRFPANVIHDGSADVTALFPDSNSSGGKHPGHDGALRMGCTGGGGANAGGLGDSGSAARFFYTAKADAEDRAGSKHPTVKPVDLMQWLVRLVTPKGGTVLDPFGGTGTTAEAAFREGMRCILMEREPQYQDDIRRRMRLALAGPDERKRESIKAKVEEKPFEPGSLFANL